MAVVNDSEQRKTGDLAQRIEFGRGITVFLEQVGLADGDRGEQVAMLNLVQSWCDPPDANTDELLAEMARRAEQRYGRR